MALQELSPQPQVTGYAALGNAINQGAQQWRERQQQLQDVSAARDYASGEAQKASERQLSNELTAGEAARKGQLSNETAMMAVRSRAAILTALQAEGLLQPGEENDMAKVAAAYKEFQARGLEKLYADMLSTPDETGAPILSDAQVGDPVAVKAAKDKYFAVKAKQLAFKTAQGPAAVSDLTSVTQQEAAVQQQMAQVFDAMQKIPTEPPLPATPDEIQRHAYDLALIQNGGKKPSRDQVANAYSKAQEDLTGQRNMQFMQAQRVGEQLRNQYGALNQQLSNLRQTKEAYIRQGYAPTAAAPSAAVLQQPTTAPAVAPKFATADNVAKASAAVGLGAGAPAASSAASNLTDPSTPPATSVLGLINRAPQAVSGVVSAPATAVDAAGRYGGALLTGLWNGNFQVPQSGIIDAGRNLFNPSQDESLQPSPNYGSLPTPDELGKFADLPLTLRQQIQSLTPQEQDAKANEYRAYRYRYEKTPPTLGATPSVDSTGIQQMLQDTKVPMPVGRPITSAPPVFPTITNDSSSPQWWQMRGLPVPAGLQ